MFAHTAALLMSCLSRVKPVETCFLIFHIMSRWVLTWLHSRLTWSISGMHTEMDCMGMIARECLCSYVRMRMINDLVRLSKSAMSPEVMSIACRNTKRLMHEHTHTDTHTVIYSVDFRNNLLLLQKRLTQWIADIHMMNVFTSGISFLFHVFFTVCQFILWNQMRVGDAVSHSANDCGPFIVPTVSFQWQVSLVTPGPPVKHILITVNDWWLTAVKSYNHPHWTNSVCHGLMLKTYMTQNVLIHKSHFLKVFISDFCVFFVRSFYIC